MTEITQDVIDICAALSASGVVTEKTQALGRNGSITQLTPISSMTQVVAGTNYFIKAKIGESEEYVHLRVYMRPGSAASDAQLSAIQVQKSADDELTYFEAL